MQALVVEGTWHDGVLLLHLAGDLDVYSAPVLRDHLSAALSPSGARAARADRELPGRAAVGGDGGPGTAPGDGAGVVVDLARVPFIDSAGLGVLVAGYKAALAVGQDLVLCGLSPVGARLLHVTGVDRVVTIHVDAETAVGDLLHDREPRRP